MFVIEFFSSEDRGCFKASLTKDKIMMQSVDYEITKFIVCTIQNLSTIFYIVLYDATSKSNISHIKVFI